MDIGFYLISADHSAKCDSIVATINSMVESHPYDNIVLFNSQYNRMDNNKKFPILHLNQAKYFRGFLVIFDAKSAMVTKTFPSPRKQLFYVDEKYWETENSLPALFWHTIYMNPNIALLSNNQTTHDILNICWSAPIGMMENINAKELYETILKLQ